MGLKDISAAPILGGPQPPSLSSVSVSPTSVAGTAQATGTVTVDNLPTGSKVSVFLTSSNPAVRVPESVTVGSPSLGAAAVSPRVGASPHLSFPSASASFPVTTTAVAAAITATITATYNGVSQTATLTVNPAPAPAVPAYLSSLTLSSTTITGGTGATGTVTLSSSAPANIVVALHSSNSAATVPATCTVSAGATQATFSITTTAVSAAVLATLSGSYNGWIQGDDLSVQPSTLPTAPPPGVPVIHVAPGNGCAVVSWNRLADGTVSGYNVYRTSGGTTTLLTPKPFQSNFYPDTGLTNDTAAYTYQVSAVDIQGHEQPLSNPVSATPSSATATLNWINPPSAVTDTLTMTVALSSGGRISSDLFFIDGVQAGGAGSHASVDANGVQTYNARAGFDSTKLSNGPHTVQYLGFADADNIVYNTVAAVTPPITIQVNNTVSSFHVDDSGFDPTQGELCYLSATAPAGSTWMVQVTSQDGSTVFRTWQGASSLVKLAWDGNDASGKPVALTDYALQLTIQPPGTSPNTTGAQTAPSAAGTVTKKHPVSPQHGQPIALALVSIGASYYVDSNGVIVPTPAQDIMLANVLTNAYTTLFGASNFKVIRSDTFDPGDVDENSKRKRQTDLQKLEGWLGTAQVFYLFGHGAGTYGTPGETQTPRSTAFGSVDAKGIHLDLFAAHIAFDPGYSNIDVPKYVGSHQYVFSWIDSCNSAGGNTVTGEIGTPDYAWATAFNATTFVGDNGFMIINNGSASSSIGLSAWYNWRQTFWGKMARGEMILQAYQNCWSPSGAVNTSTYYSRYFLNSTQTFYDCTPGDGYGGNPRVVLYGDPFGTSLML